VEAWLDQGKHGFELDVQPSFYSKHSHGVE